MGQLIDGIWHDQWYDTRRTGGHFIRPDSKFRIRVTADGAAGRRRRRIQGRPALSFYVSLAPVGLHPDLHRASRASRHGSPSR
jgi:glutathionyl-hydroquinone reductase